MVKMKRRRGKGEEEGEDAPPLAKKGKIKDSLIPPPPSLLSLSDDVLLGVLR